MLLKNLNTDGIVNDSVKDVFFKRKSVRMLDPHYMIPREEITQMIQEAMFAAPSAVDTQPYHFLVIDTDEGKEKIDQIMRGADKDRTNQCSFTVLPFSDQKWFEHFDEHIGHIAEELPAAWNEDVENMMVPAVTNWVDELCEGDASYLHKSVDFQAGLITMSFLFIVRAHGYEAGFMDSWDPQMVGEAFGVDTDRFRPQGAIAVGKGVESLEKASASSAMDLHEYRADASSKIEFA